MLCQNIRDKQTTLRQFLHYMERALYGGQKGISKHAAQHKEADLEMNEVSGEQ